MAKQPFPLATCNQLCEECDRGSHECTSPNVCKCSHLQWTDATRLDLPDSFCVVKEEGAKAPPKALTSRNHRTSNRPAQTKGRFEVQRKARIRAV